MRGNDRIFLASLAVLECGMGDGDGCAVGCCDGFDDCVELLCQRLDDAGPKASLGLRENTVWPAHPVVDDGKLPVCSIDG